MDIYVVFVIQVLVFASIILFVGYNNTDLPAHIEIAQERLVNNDWFSGNFLFYTLLNLFSLLTGNWIVMSIVLCLMLATATTVKYLITKSVLSQYLPNSFAVYCSFSLLFVYIIPVFAYLKIFGIFLSTNSMYLGYYVPNVWHNSTTIFLFPFAIFLFFLSCKQLECYCFKRNWIITLLVILNVFIKPSFFFVFVCAYPLMLLYKYGLKKSFWLSIFTCYCWIIMFADRVLFHLW